VQAQPDGGEVAVTAEQKDGALRIEIADRGPGIPEDRVNEIYEPFKSFRTGGTGLGLAICKRMASEENASIGHHARDKGGSIFSVSWPV
jgi:signal transduction histidine kinase